MANLKDLESKSIFILREVKKRFKNPVVLWSIGKDSTTLLYLCRKAFYDEIPFKVLHIDTETEYEETYEFRDRIAKEWKLDLVVGKSEEKFKEKTCTSRKTEILKKEIEKHKFDAVIVGIRRDENSIRGMERYFSPRDREFRWNVTKEEKNEAGIGSAQDAELSGWDIYATEFKDSNHVRIHPLLHWTELDIWQYIKKENIPVVNLYFAKDGKRFRSIGCKCCSSPVKSRADTIDKIIKEIDKDRNSERQGRDTEKEYNMQKLRSLGYM
ncbi:TPA: sulfate adenylyltransferase subunit CysD [Candidatus Woesearchaeota archaeon]|nr:Sulfate adenylyltransferase subunit 2 [archaeon GW2011_AR15]MBS3104519.1 sulfate adenylyltransferase subunit CysD [Candidatus Woesearchaeota archaeon]HIH41167.1 sulfate adenylyltransferase subunit CysD [Candidatus Woesearchaeota archaeon]